MKFIWRFLEQYFTIHQSIHNDIMIPCQMQNPESYANGSWVRNDDCIENIHGNVVYPETAFRGDFCYKESSSDLLKIKEMSLCYDYLVETCSLKEFSLAEQKNLLEDVCFVGDSLLQQLAEAASFTSGTKITFHKSYLLVNFLNMKPMTPEEIDLCENLEYSSEVAACQQSGRYLDQPFQSSMCPPKRDFSPQQCENKNYKIPFTLYHRSLSSLKWTKMLDHCSFLVFNTGHHFYKEGSEFYNIMAKNVVQYLQEHFVSNKSNRVIFVSSPIGHSNATLVTEPQYQLVDASADKYHWLDVFKKQNMWNILFDEANNEIENLFSFLDITHLSLLRPDAHPPNDGLHYCPGKGSVPEVWYKLLLNLLHELRS